MNIVLFFIVILASFAIVRVGAVAFQLTGLEWSLAKFQALSCFTGTGFTTREAETITTHPQRRKIASILMVLGNAGLITLIATFANTLRAELFLSSLALPFVEYMVPQRLLPVMNLLIILFLFYIVYKVLSNSTLIEKFTSLFRRYLTKRQKGKPITFEELLVSTGGYGISTILLPSNSPLVGQTIKESPLRENDINLLAIVRDEKTTPNPSSSATMLADDHLICFGRLDDIRKIILGEQTKG